MFKPLLVPSLVLAMLPAAALAVPAATVTGQFYDGRYDYNGGYAMPTAPGTFASGPAGLAIVGGDHPSVSARCGLPASNFSCYATGQLTYYFQLLGLGTEIVPLHAHVIASVHQSADFNGVFAEVGISNPTSRTGVVLGPNTGSGTNADFEGDLDFSAAVGDVTKVDLQAGIIFTVYDNSAGVTGSAFADPYITIDPVFAAAHPGYSLSFSSGIGNAPPGGVGGVPEPMSWALMMFGFGIAGTRLRRRRTLLQVTA